MKSSNSLLLATLLFSACGDSPSDPHAHHATAPSAVNAVASSNPVLVVDGVTQVDMTANDQMKYNVDAFTVPAGGAVKLTLRNIGKMPKASMGHNVVFLSADADPNAFAAAAAAARDSDYIPASLQTQILASSKLLGPGEMDSINFTAPSEPGNYTFLCSFPAHMFAGMRGIMTVE
ncbi:MAG: azurin [Puniceicoccaceae bacterium]|jgi:azurin|nr:azurin [Puniceicoccaceae bacterium]MBL6913377.1 azurin [Puniceicoccaceae bacterium]